VRNPNLSDSFSLQEDIKKHPEIIRSNATFFMISDLIELAE
jgi:hypothetical protein